MAVSSESIRASVPSRTALATSEASARNGRGLSTIERSIWVAVITGRPARRARSMIFFWIIGTRSGGISTPRSPRATMIPSTASMMGSSRSTAWGFSILAISIGGCSSSFSRARTGARSSSWRTNESATKSTPSSRPTSRSAKSLSVTAATRRFACGRFTPLRDVTVPPLMTRHSSRSIRPL